MKKYVLLILILVCTALVARSYFVSGVPYTHDGENHLARFANYKIALREGQFPPRFAPNLFSHYGYPVFNYNYPLANIVAMPFVFIKLEYELVFKLLVGLSLVFGGVGVWQYAKSRNSSTLTEVIVVLLWFATPYLFSLVLFRGNIGEVMAYALLPWLFLSLQKPIEAERWPVLKQLGVILLWTAFFLAHNSTVLFGVPLLLLLAIAQHQKSLLKAKRLALLLLAAVGLSLWFWLPALVEVGEVVVASASNQQAYQQHFVELHQLFTPLQFGFSEVGSVDGLSFAPGGLQLLVLMLALAMAGKQFIWHKRRWSGFESTILLAACGSLLLQFSFTKNIWLIVPMVNFLQFPWRLGLFLAFLLVPITISVLAHLSRRTKLFLLLMAAVQIIALAQAQPIDRLDKTNLDYDAFTQSTSTQNENLPRSFTFTELGNWQPTPEIISGTGSAEVETWTGSQRKYQLNLETPSTIVEPTMYFLGWQTSVVEETSGDKSGADYIDDDEIRGRIAYQLQPGSYSVTSRFTQNTPARIFGNGISGVTAVILLIWLGKSYGTPKKHQQPKN